MTQSPNQAVWIYRAIAAIGAVMMASHYQWVIDSTRPSNEWIYAQGAGIAGVLVLIKMAPEGFRLLSRHLDLLVPFGCYQCVTHLLGFLVLPRHLLDLLAQHASLFDYGLAPVLMMVIMFLAWVFWVVWQTRLIVQVASSDDLDLAQGFSDSLVLLPRGIAICVLGLGGAMAPLMLAIWVGVAQESVLFLLVVIAIWTVIWSFLTCLWLPLALDRETPFWTSIQDATRVGRDSWRQWLLLILGWTLACGLVTRHTFSTSTPGSHHSVVSWNVTTNWFGAYPQETAWYSELADTADVTELGFYAAMLVVLFLGLAIAVKLEILRRCEASDLTAR